MRRAAIIAGGVLLLAAVSGGSFGAPVSVSSGSVAEVVLTPQASPSKDGLYHPGELSDTGSPSPLAASSTAAVTLRVGWLGGPDAVDPVRGQSVQERVIVHLTHDLLTGYRADDMGPCPELAQSWSCSEDGLTWTFKVRAGTAWHDGEPVTAEDVAFTYAWVMENRVSPYASLTTGIQSIEVVDDQTVVFSCSEPKADMDALWIPILPEHLWSDVDPEDDEAVGAVPAVGDGPFRLVSFEPGRLVRLRADESYWHGAPAIEEVHFISYRDPQKMADDLVTGVLDAAAGLPADRFGQLRRDARLQTVAAPGRGFVDLGFVCAPTATDSALAAQDQAFRQALGWAIDRQGIIDRVYGGRATTGSTIVAPGLRRDPDYHLAVDPGVRYGYDLKKAARLLQDAGYVKMAGRLIGPDSEPVELRLYASDSPPQGGKIAGIVAKSLRALGITVEYTHLATSSLRARLAVTLDGQPKPDADLFISDWIGDTDPTFILSVLTSSQIGAWNDTGWTSTEYDALFAKQAAALDEAERKALVDQMQQIAYDESPYAVIAYPQVLEAARSDRWQGWVQAPAGTGSALVSADNVDTYLYLRPKVDAEPATVTPWWVWPAIAAACLVGAAVLWAASRGLGWYGRRRTAAEAARRPAVRPARRRARPARSGGDAEV